jgi:hypothetical protein
VNVEWHVAGEGTDEAGSAERRLFDALATVTCPAHHRHLDALTIRRNGNGYRIEGSLCCEALAAEVATRLETSGSVVPLSATAPARRKRKAG